MTNTESRTRKGIRNTAFAVVMYTVNILLQFVSRRVFIDRLGDDVLGLNTTATSILQFLNLAELGIGTAVICTLYKPMRNDDRTTVSEVLSVQGWLYRRVALIIIAASMVVMCFFPMIFGKSGLPLWYAYASFSVLLFSSLLSYFVNYREAVLCADQAEYKIQYSFKLVMLFKVVAQIVAVLKLENGYVAWLVLEALFAVFASVALNRTINRSYPYLREKVSCTKPLREKHNDVIVMVKQVFVHKIGTFAISQSTPLVIYGLATLALVTKYGNYMVIVSGLTSILFAVFNSLGAGVGNLIAEGDTEHTYSVFKELFAVRFFCVTSCCAGLYFLAAPFVSLWLGPEYVLDQVSLLLIIGIFYLNQMRTITDIFLYGYGMFQDIWAPIVESVLNIGLAVLFGHFWGLPGILSGVLISLVLIHFIWKPYFLFSSGFHYDLLPYVWFYAKFLLMLVASSAIAWIVSEKLTFLLDNSVWGLVGYALAVCASFCIMLFSLQLALDSSMRKFVSRFICLKRK